MSKNYFLTLSLVGIVGVLFGAYALNSVLPLPFARASNGSSETGVQTWVIFGGTLVAFIAILAGSYHNERTHKIQNTLNTLQSLRTDKDYLDRARIVKNFVNGDFSKPISAAQTVELMEGRKSAPLCACCGLVHDGPNDITTLEAVNFVLNQYEFITGAVRLGAADVQMINWTVRSVIINLLTAYQPYILRIRCEQNERYFENLVWFAHKCDPASPLATGLLWTVPKR